MPSITPLKDSLIDRTLAVWQPRARRRLSREDAREIVENAGSFFSILEEWDAKEGATDPATPSDTQIDRLAPGRRGIERR